MSERICAKCGREISSVEHPWTFTGCPSEEFEIEFDKSVFVCEGCYDNRPTDTAGSNS